MGLGTGSGFRQGDIDDGIGKKEERKKERRMPFVMDF
jgi:hypothetical protein